MRIFTLSRTSALPGGRSRELSDSLRHHVPARFEALGEALAANRDVEAACSVIGRELARDGLDLATALEMLRTTYVGVVGREPDFSATHVLCLAWSEETLAYLHQLSCEDPLTGLSTLAHLRARISEVYRGEELAGLAPGSTHALVVVDLPRSTAEDRFAHALRQVRTVETVRLVFPGSESIGEVCRTRIVVVTPRNDVLGRKVKALRTLLDEYQAAAPVRVWIEGLPSQDAAAGAVLDELART